MKLLKIQNSPLKVLCSTNDRIILIHTFFIATHINKKWSVVQIVEIVRLECIYT